MQNLLIWTRRSIIAAMLVLVAVYVVFFTFNNSQQVSIDFLFLQWPDAPIEAVIVSMFISGGLAGMLYCSGLWLRCRSQLNAARVELNKLKR